jgi:hypothetical protein
MPGEIAESHGKRNFHIYFIKIPSKIPSKIPYSMMSSRYLPSCPSRDRQSFSICDFSTVSTAALLENEGTRSPCFLVVKC